MKKTTVLFLLFLLVLTGAHASESKRFITVTGEAEVKAVPDRVMLSFGVNSEAKDVEAAKKDNDKKISGVLSSLEKNGIDEKDIQTDRMTISPRYDYDKGRKLIGYTVAKNITVLLKDISLYEKIVEDIVSAGTNYLNSTEFIVSDKRKYEDEARNLALKAAAQKANAMAAALGVIAGRVLEIEEADKAYTPYMRKSTANAAVESPGAGSGGNTVSPGTVKITAAVIVKFELK